MMTLAWTVLRRRRLRTSLFVLQFVLALTMCIVAVAYLAQAWYVLRLPVTVLGQDALGLYLVRDEQLAGPEPGDERGVVAADVAAIRALPGVRRAAVFYQTIVYLGGAEARLVLVNDDYLELAGARAMGGLAAGDLNVGPDGTATAWLTRGLARRLRTDEGQPIALRAGDIDVSACVAGTIGPIIAPPLFPFPGSIAEFSTLDQAVVVPLAAYPDISHLTNGLWVQAEPGCAEAAGEAVKGWWLAAHPGAPSRLEGFSVAEACRDSWRGALEVLRNLAPVGLLLLVLAAVGFIGTTILNVDARRVELAARRAIGATLRQVAWQLALENVLVLALAVAVATPLGAFTAIVLTPGARAPGVVIAVAVALTGLVGGLSLLLGTAYPLYRVSRDDPAAVLKEAE